MADPPEAAKKLAERKAGAVVQEVLADAGFTGMAIVLGADTMVVKDGQIFGKPKNLSDATHMLRQLSGATHQVVTAVSVWMISVPEPEKVSLGFRTFADTSRVTFHELGRRPDRRLPGAKANRSTRLAPTPSRERARSWSSRSKDRSTPSSACRWSAFCESSPTWLRKPPEFACLRHCPCAWQRAPSCVPCPRAAAGPASISRTPAAFRFARYVMLRETQAAASDFPRLTPRLFRRPSPPPSASSRASHAPAPCRLARFRPRPLIHRLPRLACPPRLPSPFALPPARRRGLHARPRGLPARVHGLPGRIRGRALRLIGGLPARERALPDSAARPAA